MTSYYVDARHLFNSSKQNINNHYIKVKDNFRKFKMINPERQHRTSGSNGFSPATVHQVCRCCYVLGLVLAGFCIGTGPIILLITSVEALGGGTVLWDPVVRYYGRIIGGVTWAAGVILLFLCWQVCKLKRIAQL